MTDKTIIARIFSLQVEGVSARKISSTVGVPISTVRGIIAREREKRRGGKISRKKSRHYFSSTRPYRCPGCGHLIQFRPCLICRDRLNLAVAHANAASSSRDGCASFRR